MQFSEVTMFTGLSVVESRDLKVRALFHREIQARMQSGSILIVGHFFDLIERLI